MPENGEELKTKDYSTISISFCLHTVSIQYSCPHLYSLKHNDLSAVWCCVPALYPYTTVLGGLSQTMHQNFQQAVSNIFTKPRGSKIYICYILFIPQIKTNLMQHCAGFISAESLYMFRAQTPIIRSI
jgi:hypothetical protein